MSECARRDEVRQAVRAGQWPQGCAADLREHVAAEHITPEQRQEEIEEVVSVLRTYLK